MKILMLHPHDIFSPNEPWTIRIVSLAREFRDQGHEVKLAYCPLHISEKKNNNIDLERIEIITLSRKAGLRTLFYNIKKIKEGSDWADIIHFQKCFHYVSIPALFCGWYLNKSLHYDWDDWEEKIWYHSNKKSIHAFIFGNFIRLLERWIPRLVDTISVSSHELEKLCISFGVGNNRILRTPVGADLRRFGPHISGESIRRKYNLQQKITILYLGQLHGGQYVKMFIEATNIILHKYPNAIFLIVGQGYMLSQLRELTEQLGIKDHIIFTGSIPHDLIPQYISASDICIASFENNELTVCKSPLKVVEYLASGKPIVASLVGEMRYMVGGVGLLVGPSSYRALADGVIYLLKDSQLRKEMGRRARQRAETRYNWKDIAGNLIKVYERSIEERRMIGCQMAEKGLNYVCLKESLNRLQLDKSNIQITTTSGDLDIIGNHLSVAALLELLTKDIEHTVRIKAVIALGKIKDKSALPALLNILMQDSSVDVRSQAALALGEIGDPESLPALLGLLMKEKEQTLCHSAVIALGKIKDKSALPTLLNILMQDPSVDIRSQAALALGEIRDKSVLPALLKVLTEYGASEIRINAALALSKIGDTSAKPALLEVMTKDEDANIREAAARALKGMDAFVEVK